MAFPDNATCFPVYGQAFDFTDCIKSSVTANPLTGGLGTLAILISKDGAAFAASVGGSVAEVASTPGFVNVSLSAADMTAKVIAYQVTSNASNAVYATGEIKTVDLSESGTRAMAQTVVKVEQIWRQGWAFEFNRTTIDRATGIYSVYNDADDTVLYVGTCTDTGAQGVGTRAKLT